MFTKCIKSNNIIIRDLIKKEGVEMLRDRKELEKNLIPAIEKVRIDRDKVDQIKEELGKYNVMSGDIQGLLSSPKKELPEIDLRLLFLFAEQVYIKSGILNINPDNYFTEPEQKTSRQYDGELEREDNLRFPITFDNVTMMGSGVYMLPLSTQIINKMSQSLLLNYNFDTQREATFKRRKDKVMVVPTVNPSSIKDIAKHLLEGTLVPTTLTFNAHTRTADSGNELTYDSKKRQLTINKGTRVDIIDGYHRTKGIQNAILINPELEFYFPVMITNYSTSQSQQYLAQIAKANPMTTERIQEFAAEKYADDVIKQLRSDSDLKDRISQTSKVHSIRKELTTYSTLSETIDEEFTMETKADAMDVGDYLCEFFNYLIGSFSNEFIKQYDEYKENSLINDNNMFAGYIVLARRMQEENLKISALKKILNNIDFNKENPLWVELGILDNGKLTIKARDNIKEYFKTLNI